MAVIAPVVVAGAAFVAGVVVGRGGGGRGGGFRGGVFRRPFGRRTVLADVRRGWGWWGDWWPSWWGYDVCLDQLPTAARDHVARAVAARDSLTLYAMSSQAADQGWLCASRQLGKLAADAAAAAAAES